MAGHNFDPEFVEFVVREVIRRLQDQSLTIQTNGPSAAQELLLQERLVTRATLEGRLKGVRRVIVGSKALVTPAVRDDLKNQDIALIRR